MKDNTILNDVHRELEFIDPNLKMSPVMCNYIGELQYLTNGSPSQSYSNNNANYWAFRLLNQQIASLNAYYNKK